MGLNATEKMGLLTVHKENFVSVVKNFENVLANNYMYPDVFDYGLGKLPEKVYLQVDRLANQWFSQHSLLYFITVVIAD